MNEVAINAPNLWRLETPGHEGWQRTARAGDPKKYFMVSTDSHANEPPDLWEKRIDAKFLGLNAARFFGLAVPAHQQI